MKTREDYKHFIDDLTKLCESHRIGLSAISIGQSAPCEIVLYDKDEPGKNVTEMKVRDGK